MHRAARGCLAVLLAVALAGCDRRTPAAPTGVETPQPAGTSSLSGTVSPAAGVLPSDLTVHVPESPVARVDADGRFAVTAVPPRISQFSLRSQGREAVVSLPMIYDGGLMTMELRLDVERFAATVLRVCSQSPPVNSPVPGAPTISATLCTGR
jgi:hypothetical protein